MTRAEMLARGKSRFPDRYKSGRLDRLTRGDVAGKLRLGEQYGALQQGDVARRLGLHKYVDDIRRQRPHHPHQGYDLARRHGHQYYHGRIHPHYTRSAFPFHYYGHRNFAGVSWYPRWDHWVDWSWHHRCHPFWDPRPLWCRPVIYEPCPSWIYYEPPVWVSLPVVTSGTWVDVEPAPVAEEQFDLQLLAVRFVDPGHPEEKLGPRYRVWFRNNGSRPISRPFDVILIAADDTKLAPGLPQSGVRVTSIEAGDVQSVDVRLPIEVYTMARDAQGNPAPFSTLHVLVDANREVPETAESNDGARIPRAEVLPVDPAAFEVQPTRAPAGGEVILAGEGFGPEPGQVLVRLGNLELEGEILGWYDLGVRLNLPSVPLAGPTEAELIVVRGDGAAAGPLKITVTPPPATPANTAPPAVPQ